MYEQEKGGLLMKTATERMPPVPSILVLSAHITFRSQVTLLLTRENGDPERLNYVLQAA